MIIALANNFSTKLKPKCNEYDVHQRDSCLAIIPNACSAKLQPLHQTIKEKFKVRSMIITMTIDYCHEQHWHINLIKDPSKYDHQLEIYLRHHQFENPPSFDQLAVPLQAGIERKYLTWAESAGQASASSRPTDPSMTPMPAAAAAAAAGGRHVEGQAAGANPGPELVLAWVDNTFHNLRQRKVISFLYFASCGDWHYDEWAIWIWYALQWNDIMNW